MAPDTDYERACYAQGYRYVAGLDEAGRGCWAGPVVAAAVVFPPALLLHPSHLPAIDDSKQLTAAQREAAYRQITALAASIGVGVVPSYLIDAFGIVPATRLAMMAALLSLSCRADTLLLDALLLPGLSLPQQALIKGDARCYSIAAASIIAKVTRDRLMSAADRGYAGYGFAAHKGYGTAAHRRALHLLGPCPLHRMTFRPVLLSKTNEQDAPVVYCEDKRGILERKGD